MKALLLVAHGSRRQASNDEVRELVERMRGQTTDYGLIDTAFLELAEPSIPDGLRNALRAGASEIVVLPYFLSAGRHVAEDIPEEVDKVRGETQVPIRVAPYLGAADEVSGLLLQQALRA